MPDFLRNSLFWLAIAALGLTPILANADDTEIYFARATADNAQNKPKANVMIMLDTSGSMRNCELGSGSTWCKDIENRRITLLQNAMKDILQNTPPTVNIGLGRFMGSSGGRVLLPVVPINDETRPAFMTALDGINQGQGVSSPSDVEPKGSTPTSLAYEEMANYMLGRSKSSYVSYPSGGGEMCTNRPSENVCRNETVWGDPVTVGWCDTNEPGCTVRYGSWNSSSQCLVDNELCRFTDWSSWSSNACSPNGLTCESRQILFWTQYRSRGYQARSLIYSKSESRVTEICEVVEKDCTETQKIISNNDKYVSPIDSANQCESNHIILFTDGLPSGDRPDRVQLVSCSGTDAASSYSCQVKTASYLNSSANDKGRPIQTHNIGLYMGSDTLKSMERVSGAGGGQTYDSNSAETLLQAFRQTLDLIDEDARSIASPGVAVNAMNRFQHLDQLYYSVFQPFESSYWQGNLKRYQLKDAEIHGVNGNAIDQQTGYFRSGSRSFWSDEIDGPDVNKGGARSNIGARKLFYTDTKGGAIKSLDWNNASIPANTFFGLSPASSAAARQELLDELKVAWGDPMHSTPVMVNYGGNAENNHVFVSTNGGMLHAIDTKTGNESFAFMPFEMISKADKYTVNRLPLNQDNTRQTYGLDGSWIAWRRSGESTMSAPEKVYLYGGMRRGGRSYYALDVTSVTSPKMLWQIDNTTPGFERLGQTWSTPTLTQIPSANGPLPVLVFGGGYSAVDHDNHKARTNGDAMGNAIFIVNALTGEKIWSAATTWAVPSSIAVVDIDFDGIADHLYYSDIGGTLYRVNIAKAVDGANTVSVVARLSDAAANRRFYEAPAVGYVKEGTKNVLYVSIGSGYRAHPLDEKTAEGFFVVRDEHALSGTPPGAAISLQNMANVTLRSPTSGDKGWYYLFSEEAGRQGEKALSSPAIFDGKILFTTYAPTDDEEQENPCAVRYGRSYLHVVDLVTGAAARLTDTVPATERSQPLSQSTPAPTPTLIVDKEGNVVVIVGTEVVGEGDLGDPRLRKRRWMQLTRDEANNIKNVTAEADENE